MLLVPAAVLVSVVMTLCGVGYAIHRAMVAHLSNRYAMPRALVQRVLLVQRYFPCPEFDDLLAQHRARYEGRFSLTEWSKDANDLVAKIEKRCAAYAGTTKQ